VTVRLLLDEHYASDIAAQLRARGYDAVSVVESSELRSRSDVDLFRWAGAEGCRIVTENIKDFRPLLLSAYSTGTVRAQLLLVSPRRFPRGGSGRSTEIVRALLAWLKRPDVEDRPDEDWLA
jgi:hypothetical protein